MASKKILTDIEVDGSVESTSFIKTGGTSSQFLKADGSVDTNTYVTSASIPTATSDLTNDSGFISSVTGDWTGTLDGQEGSYYLNYNNFTNTPTLFDGAYSSLTGTPTIPNITGKLDNTTDTLTGTLTVTQDVIADRLESSTSIQVGNDTDTASSSNVGSLRYRATSNNSYTDICMQTGPTTYEWVNIVSIQFEQP